MYAQISLGEDASAAGPLLLVFFGGFGPPPSGAAGSTTRRACAPRSLPGCVLGAVGFYLWAQSLDDFDLGDQWIYIVMAGAGCGLILGPASTDALNRVAEHRYGEATGITQTVRNFGASIGLAVLGTILISRTRRTSRRSLGALGISKERADAGRRRALPVRRRRGGGRLRRQRRPGRPEGLRGRPGRLRRRDPDGLLHHGRDHGRACTSWPTSGCPRTASSRRPPSPRTPSRHPPGHTPTPRACSSAG